MTWWKIHILVLGASAALGVGLTYLARGLGRRLNFVDRPHREAHKRHQNATPLLGGVAIYAAWLATIVGGFIVAPLLAAGFSPDVSSLLGGLPIAAPKLARIAAGGAALVALGLYDDWRPLPALAKLVGQTLVAGLIALGGIRITCFIENPPATWALTTLWIVFIINAVNFLDNMDALAGGCAAIAAFFFMVTAALRGQYFVSLMAAAVCGSAAGFLVYNRPPASVFMGDAGSHFLGYMLAVLGALTTFYSPADSPTLAPLLIPLLILAVPIFDAFAVVAIRHWEGRPLHKADHVHISHRFQRLWLTRPRSVALILLLSVAIGAGAVTLLWLPPPGAAIVFLQAGAILVMVSLLHAGVAPSAGRSDAKASPPATDTDRPC